MKTPKNFIIVFLIMLGIAGAVLAIKKPVNNDISPISSAESVQSLSQSIPVFAKSEIPATKVLIIPYHVFQTFNNCAPAALSIALSYYGIQKSQESLAADLRPYNNLQGKNDDKSTTPDELGAKAAEYGLTYYFRANGDINLLKQMIANDLPIVMRTLLETNKDFAHYRIIKGYDDTTQEIIQDDSYQGKNIRYPYSEFLKIWKPFNYEYLVLVPAEKRKVIEAILGEGTEDKASWENAIHTAKKELSSNSGDVRARFNLSVALYYTGDYEGSVKEFEKVENALPKLALWYQMEPIRAYAALGNHERVFKISDKILNGGNPAFSELYLLRGESYLAQNNSAAAKEEFRKAYLYNRNLEAAKEAFISID